MLEGEGILKTYQVHKGDGGQKSMDIERTYFLGGSIFLKFVDLEPKNIRKIFLNFSVCQH